MAETKSSALAEQTFEDAEGHRRKAARARRPGQELRAYALRRRTAAWSGSSGAGPGSAMADLREGDRHRPRPVPAPTSPWPTSTANSGGPRRPAPCWIGPSSSAPTWAPS